MGLGKTVEVLALVLAHQWPGKQRFDTSSSNSSCTNSSPCFPLSPPPSPLLGSEELKEASTAGGYLEKVTASDEVVGEKDWKEKEDDDENYDKDEPADLMQDCEEDDLFATALPDKYYGEEQSTVSPVVGLGISEVGKVVDGDGDGDDVDKVMVEGEEGKGEGEGEGEKREGKKEEGEGEGDVVRCVCGATSDFGYEGEFVQCERCGVWQHSACTGFKSSTHKNFLCGNCKVCV